MKAADKVMIVTGAGSGIGRALVLNLINKGARVAAVDLNAESLKETQSLAGDRKDRVSVHVLSVADRKAVEALPAQVIKAHGAVDGLINCAGIIQPFLRLNDLKYEDIERVLNVNLYGVIYMTKTFLPHLLERPVAHIVNVSSMGGFFPVPGQTLYGASKAGIKLLTEGLYAELIGTGVRVTVVFPGAIATNITQNSGVTALPTPESAGNIPITSPQAAARMIVNGMERNHFQVYVGNDAKIMDILYRINPKLAAQLMYGVMKGLLQDGSN